MTPLRCARNDMWGDGGWVTGSARTKEGRAPTRDAPTEMPGEREEGAHKERPYGLLTTRVSTA